MHEILNSHALQWCKSRLCAIYRSRVTAGKKITTFTLKAITGESSEKGYKLTYIKAWADSGRGLIPSIQCLNFI